jgi:hypothetical protein
MIDDDVAERIAPRSVTYDVTLLIEKCEQKEIMHPALEIITADLCTLCRILHVW